MSQTFVRFSIFSIKKKYSYGPNRFLNDSYIWKLFGLNAISFQINAAEWHILIHVSCWHTLQHILKPTRILHQTVGMTMHSSKLLIFVLIHFHFMTQCERIYSKEFYLLNVFAHFHHNHFMFNLMHMHIMTKTIGLRS